MSLPEKSITCSFSSSVVISLSISEDEATGSLETTLLASGTCGATSGTKVITSGTFVPVLGILVVSPGT